LKMKNLLQKKIKSVLRCWPYLLLLLFVFIPAGEASAKFEIGAIPVIGPGLALFEWATGGSIAEQIFASLANLLLAFFGRFLEMAGIFLNFAIVMTVQKMSIFINHNEGIKVAWEVIRDILNIGFIFTIVYIGVSTILRLGSNLKKTLVNVIVAALLVNFSFFFTGVLIDASNITTLSVYNQIKNVQANTGHPFVEGIGFSSEVEAGGSGEEVSNADLSRGIDIVNVGISGIFMQHLKMQTIFSLDSDVRKAASANSLESSSIVLISIFASIIIFILTFVFLTVALLLLMRLVILIILMILSPVGFAGWAIQGMKSWSDQWWKALWSQLLFAPLYMILTLVIILIIGNPGFKSALAGVFNYTPEEFSLASFNDAIIGGLANDMIVFVNYTIILGLIISSIVLAKQTSASGGGQITVWTNRLGGFIGKRQKQAQGLIGRNTVGRAAEFVGGKAEKFRKTQEESGDYSDDFAGRLTLRAVTGLARGLETAAGKGRSAKFGGEISRKDATEAGTRRLREGLKKRASDPEAQARFLRNLSPGEQQKAHSEMSHRNRAALENSLRERWQEEGLSLEEIEGRINNLRSRLSVEDKEKTDEGGRKALNEAQAREREANLKIALGISPGGEEERRGPAEAIRLMDEMDDKEFKDLGGEIFTTGSGAETEVRREILDRLQVSDFGILQRSEKLNRTQKARIGAYIWEKADRSRGNDPVFQSYLRGPAGNHWLNPENVVLPSAGNEDRPGGLRT